MSKKEGIIPLAGWIILTIAGCMFAMVLFGYTVPGCACMMLTVTIALAAIYWIYIWKEPPRDDDGNYITE